MPNKVNKYECIYCEQYFDTEEEALACERCHQKATMVEYKYYSDDIYPSKIIVYFGDGVANEYYVDK